MASLASNLRRQLENVIIEARDLAEAAARSALQKRAVDATEPFPHFTAADRDLRNRLRARGRQAGDIRQPNGKQDIDQLTQELAYEFWHRMLFARFLAENHLLMHPDGVAVSLAECEELARSEGAANGYVLAARYASKMLPQIFRTDDVLLEIDFPVNDRLPLEKVLNSLPKEVFTADDSLGWVYQFWQGKRKDEVNRSGEKIDGKTLPAVTQLFTEDYMVHFLLHNTVGAWWCVGHGIKGEPGGAGVAAGKAPAEMPYLRWSEDGTPAAGMFVGWPKSLKEFTMLDPCCGSGHFLVAAFNLLVPLRMCDENLSALDASDLVLRENLLGLELDPRCTQIAAFALALAAWKFPNGQGEPIGYRNLPPLRIACSGQAVTGKKEEWLVLASGNNRHREGMEQLYHLFKQAQDVGSLIDPRREAGDMFVAGFRELQPFLQEALAKEGGGSDADIKAVGIAAQGIAQAAEILGMKYTLVATNVPYLKREKQTDVVADYCEKWHSDAKSDLATCFVDRIYQLLDKGGVAALVTPHNWLYARSYTTYRKRTLKEMGWLAVARLGHGAFETISGEVVKPVLLILGERYQVGQTFRGIDVSTAKTASLKAEMLRHGSFGGHKQDLQLHNPDAVVSLVPIVAGSQLSDYADTAEGLSTGDGDRFIACFWELCRHSPVWEPLQAGPGECPDDFGLQQVVRWESGKGELASSSQARIQGQLGWGANGVLVSEMNDLRRCLHAGFKHDKTTGVVVPKRKADLPAIWAFCQSDEYVEAVRNVDKSLKVAPRSLAKVPFDPDYWRTQAEELFPDGLPPIESSDPTQWVFKGTIAGSSNPLQVAVARLVGYCWPQHSDSNTGIECLADSDGIVGIPSVRGEQPAAERLLELLRCAYRDTWSSATTGKLIVDSGCKAGTSLNDWLRNVFFEQHCKRFLNRPFVWQIWDGVKDGFSCLVNYHRLTHKGLENLTYSYLQDWITAQSVASKDGKPGADLRLAGAQGLQAKLKMILKGEPPYDIFVRWKPLAEQPIGWDPDLNDGVRLNIRPFMTAGILRKNPNIKWTKDRGKDAETAPWFNVFKGERINDHHLTTAEKQAARKKKGA